MPKLGMEKVRRKQIIDSVLKCVANEGIDKVTLEKTAKEAGVSKGVVAYYFKSKKKLLLESFREFLNTYLEAPENLYNSSEGSISAKEILLFIGQYALGLLPHGGNLTQEDSKKILMQIYSRMTVSDEYKVMMSEMYDKYYESTIMTLDFGIENNEFSIEDTQSAAIQLMALLDGIIIYSVMGFHGTNEELYSKYQDFVESLNSQ